MKDQQITKIWQNFRGKGIAQRVAVRYQQHNARAPDVVPSEWAQTVSRIEGACIDFLNRGHRKDADECLRDAAAIEDAIRVLQKRAEMFASYMFSGDGGACQRRAMWSLEEFAAGLRRGAIAYSAHPNKHTFFYCLGARFRGLPLPSARDAQDVYDALAQAIHDVEPKCTPATVYDAANQGSQIRRLMKAGQANAGG